MRQIRPLTEEEHLPFARIVYNAYPAFPVHTEDELRQAADRWLAEAAADPTTLIYGAFDDGVLTGGMRLFDFIMNTFGAQVPTGGLALVAVDLLHKKEHIAKDIVTFYLDHYHTRGYPFAALYPFRPDFYRQMGFGYGTKMSEYRLRPADLPAGDKRGVAFLTNTDIPAVLDCYDRYQQHTHGMMRRAESDFTRRFSNAENRAVGCWRDGQLDGYLVFTFKPGNPDNFLSNDIYVAELVYTSRDALAALFAFLRSQADQISYVVLRSQDEHFHYLFPDPRNNSGEIIRAGTFAHITNTAGVGLMYRVLDTPAAFRALADHDFGGQTLRLKLTIADSFFPSNDGSLIIAFDRGHAKLTDAAAHDAEIRLDVAAFSSLLLGVVPFKTLHTYGLAEISDPSHLATVNRIFLTDEPPMCLTAF
ncbi:MAG: hypothetical protein OJF49_001856 [Ktedonobacterales bacterium]|jgi:predicted acetyltransferase|nr:MAG: hypothetical protein OJF49_001856 [Ktedonobacterales bacterium]